MILDLLTCTVRQDKCATEEYNYDKKERFMDKVNVNDVQLAYERRGNGGPLVLLHGYPLDHHLWDEVIPLLDGTFDLIAPDLRGFGESTIGDPSPSMEDYAADKHRRRAYPSKCSNDCTHGRRGECSPHAG